MPLFEYKGYDHGGKPVSGTITAETVAQARSKVRHQEVFISGINATRREALASGSGPTGWWGNQRKLNRLDRIALFRQLSALLISGMTMTEALKTIEGSLPPRSNLKTVVLRLQDRLTEGQSLSESLAADPRDFSSMLVQMVRMGEHSGALATLLNDYADLLDKRAQSVKKLQQILAYPLFLAVFGLAITLFLLRVIVPKMAVLFSDGDRLLPVSTQILLKVSDFVQHHSSTILLLTLLMIGLLFGSKRIPVVAKGIDRGLFKLGFYRKAYQLWSTSRLTSLWSTMLKCGLPLTQALQLSTNTLGNHHMQLLLKESIHELQAGGSFAGALGKRSVLPPMAVQMIEVGERSGHLEKMLERVAAYYRTQWEQRLVSITTMLGPLLIVILGGLVGFVVVSICLPIFELNQLVGGSR